MKQRFAEHARVYCTLWNEAENDISIDMLKCQSHAWRMIPIGSKCVLYVNILNAKLLQQIYLCIQILSISLP